MRPAPSDSGPNQAAKAALWNATSSGRARNDVAEPRPGRPGPTPAQASVITATSARRKR